MENKIEPLELDTLEHLQTLQEFEALTVKAYKVSLDYLTTIIGKKVTQREKDKLKALLEPLPHVTRVSVTSYRQNLDISLETDILNHKDLERRYDNFPDPDTIRMVPKARTLNMYGPTIKQWEWEGGNLIPLKDEELESMRARLLNNQQALEEITNQINVYDRYKATVETFNFQYECLQQFQEKAFAALESLRKGEV